jgi:hypothetical protein
VVVTKELTILPGVLGKQILDISLGLPTFSFEYVNGLYIGYIY